QVQYLEEHPNVDLVGTAIYSMNSHDEPAGVRGLDKLDQTLASILRKGLLAHPTVLARNQWFRKNPYHPLFVRAEDLELWCRTCGTTEFAKIEEPLLFYREARVKLSNYLRTQQTVRMVLRVHGAPALGRWATFRLALSSYSKSLAYRLFALAGLQET